MGLFRRNDTIDLTDSALARTSGGAAERRTAIQAGVPGRCPTCDGYGYIDHIDMVHRYQRQHCRTCSHVWEYTFDEAGNIVDRVDIEQGSHDRLDSGIQI